MKVVNGTVHAIEQVYLTLGWDPDGRVIGYLEFLPGLAVQSYERGDSKP
uniref:Glyoxalase n=1 Tax=Steinernema glaseri TaxID=37863 RepID=A0A1I7YAQ3_9BILA